MAKGVMKFLFKKLRKEMKMMKKLNNDDYYLKQAMLSIPAILVFRNLVPRSLGSPRRDLGTN